MEFEQCNILASLKKSKIKKHSTFFFITILIYEVTTLLRTIGNFFFEVTVKIRELEIEKENKILLVLKHSVVLSPSPSSLVL